MIEIIYNTNSSLIAVCGLIPNDNNWNLLKALFETNDYSNSDLPGTVEFRNGEPSVSLDKGLGYLNPSVINLLIGTEGKRTKWERFEITEEEPRRIQRARRTFLTPESPILDSYWLKSLTIASGQDEKDFMTVECYLDGRSPNDVTILYHPENLEKGKQPYFERIIDRFNKGLKCIYSEDHGKA